MEISKRVVARLCRYRTALLRFREYGMKAIFSEELAQSLGLTSAQVRKDFSLFHITGKKKAGYRIDLLMNQINHILEKTRIQRVIILGAGAIGQALVRDSLLTDNAMAAAALFDEEKKVAGLPPYINDVPVLPLPRLIHFVHTHNIKYAVLTVTDSHAQRVLDEAIIAGIHGILNLSGHELKAPRNCTLHSVSLCSEIENLIFFTQQKLKTAR